MRFAPEGLPFILVSTAILLMAIAVGAVFGGLWWIFPIAWAPIAAWVPAFFRDPQRPGERGEGLIIAPADGVVVSIAKAEEPEYLGTEATRVSIFMNVFNVHVNRFPASGTVEHRHYKPGKFFNATLDKASELNEQSSLGIACGRGRMLVRQIAGLVARRIVTDPSPGDRVAQGDRLGLIRFGSRVDTFIEGDPEITVKLGQKTRAGETVIGAWR